jgi:hypothetical protein
MSNSMSSNQVVRLNANLRPEAAAALDDLAERIGGNRTTALHQAILLADLLYKEAADRGTIQVKKLGSSSKTLVLPKIDPELAQRVSAQLQDDPADTSDEEAAEPAVAPDSTGSTQG